MPTQPVQPSPRVPKDQLLKIVKTISQVQCVWSTAKRPQLGLAPNTEPAWIYLGVQSLVAKGVDELRMIYDPAADQNRLLLIGERQFTLVVRAMSLSPSIEAYDLCERVRFGFRRQTARDLMVPTIALRDFGPIQTFPEYTESDGQIQRPVLMATLDVRLACVVSADPDDLNEGNYIKTAAVEPGVVAPPGVPAGPGGNLLP